MARGINKVTILGHLGSDPEVRYTQNGSAVTTISVATSYEWKDKQTDKLQSETEWHRIIFFNRLAEVAGEFLKKGREVYVEGRNRTRKWQDKEGTDRYSTEVIASEMQLIGGSGDKRNQPIPTDTYPETNQAPSTPPEENVTGQPDQPGKNASPAIYGKDPDLDEAIPFQE